MPRRTLPLLLVAIQLVLSACARTGDLGAGVRGVLADDLPCALHRPRHLERPAPALVFLSGLLAPEEQYES